MAKTYHFYSHLTLPVSLHFFTAQQSLINSMFSPGLLGTAPGAAPSPQSPKASTAAASQAGNKATPGGASTANTALQMQLAAYAAMMGLPSMPLSQDTSKMSPEELTMLKMYEQMAAALTGKAILQFI